jgi:hypothetical protein
MTPFELHPAFYSRPIHLSKEEQANPLELLQDFFFCNLLPDIRSLLWQMVVNSLCVPDSAFDQAGHRQSLLALYRDLERVLEAAWLLSHRKEDIPTDHP